MEQVLTIIQREFLVRVRRRAFLIGLLITPLMLLVYGVVSIVLVSSTNVERQVLVLDQSNDPALFAAIEDRARNTSLGTRFRLSQVVVPPGEDIDEVRRKHNAGVATDAERAYVVLRPGVLGQDAPEYYARNTSDSSIANLGRALSLAISARRLENAGIGPDKVDQFTKQVDLKMFRIDEEGESQEKGQGVWIPLVLFFLINMAVTSYGRRVMMAVIEEKQTRVIEVVVSSVKPFNLMLGKILGIGLVGLTQFTIGILTLLAFGLLAAGLLSPYGFQLPSIEPGLLAYFLIYFLLGYFLFGTIYSVVGSMVSNPEDTAQLQRPLNLLNFVPMVMVWFVMRDPNGPASAILSMVPFFSPMLMVTRIAVVRPPLWQVALSILLLCLSIVAAIWVAAKVYRVAILIYGKRPTLAQIGRLLKYA